MAESLAPFDGSNKLIFTATAGAGARAGVDLKILERNAGPERAGALAGAVLATEALPFICAVVCPFLS